MSTTTSLIQTTVGAVGNVPFSALVRGLFSVSALAALLMFFKPLLVGIGRALVLVVKPRYTKEELAARRHKRDAEMLQRAINRSNGPSHMAELRALAARE